MTPLPPHHGFDLQERTFRFARQATLFCRRLPETVEKVEHIRQLIRFSASVGANYIEANEALGKNNFTMHARISRKEAEESAFFLRLLTETNTGEEYREEGEALTQEAMELKKIFSANVLKCEGK